MADAHVVQELCFEVDFATSELAWEAQDRVSAFAHGVALRIVEEEFAAASAEGEVLRLDALELDLGEVEAGDLEAQWSQRLREALQRRLAAQREQRAELGQDGNPDAGMGAEAAPLGAPSPWRSGAQAALEALLHFLQHGRLPWHRPDAVPAALAGQVWSQSAPMLVQQLRALAATPGAARQLAARLARQFPAHWLLALESALQAAAGDTPAGAPTLGGSTPWPAGTADAEQRLQRALRLGQPLPALLSAGPPQPAALAVPAGWAAAPRGAAPAAVRQPDAVLRAGLRRFKALLLDDAPTLSDEDLQELLALWRGLSRDDPEGLRQCLRSLGVLARVRRRIAGLWPEALLEALPVLWLPAPDVQPLLAQLRRPQGPGASAARRRAWEALLRQWLAADPAAPGSAVAPARILAAEATAVAADADVDVDAGADTAEAVPVRSSPLAEAPSATSAGDPPLRRLRALVRSDAAAARSGLRTLAAGWANQRVLGAVLTRAELADLLRAWLPRDEAWALAGLADEPLPRAWRAAAPLAASPAAVDAAAPADAARRRQWLLQALAAAPAEGVSAAALAQAGWRALAVQQGRSPLALCAALLEPLEAPARRPRSDESAGSAAAAAADAADRARREAWRRWLPAHDAALDAAQLRLRLAAAAAGGDWRRASADAERLLAEAPDEFFAWLRDCSGDPVLRRRLAWRLPAAVWRMLPGALSNATDADADAESSTPLAAGGGRAARRQALGRARRLAGAVRPSAVPAIAGAPAQAQAQRGEAWAASWRGLQDALQAGDTARVQAHWGPWLAADPPRLREALAAAGASGLFARRLAEQGSAAQWDALLTRLARPGSALALRLARGAAHRATGAAGEQGERGPGPAQRLRWLAWALATPPSADRATRPQQDRPMRSAWTLAGAVAAALQGTRPGALAAAWQALTQADARLARAALTHLASDAPIRAQLAAGLTPAMRAALLARLLPSAARAQVQGVLDLLDLPAASADAPPDARPVLQARLLSLLVWAPGTPGAGCVESLLEQAAWQRGLSVPALAQRLQALARERGMPAAGLAAWAAAAPLLAVDVPRPAAPGGAGADAAALSAITQWLRGPADALPAPAVAPGAERARAALLAWCADARHPARDALRRELESPLAAQGLAQALTAAELLRVLAWLRPADAAALHQAWPALQALAAGAGGAGASAAWPVLARAALRELVEHDRPLHPPGLLQRSAAALQRAQGLAKEPPPRSDPLAWPWDAPPPDEPVFVDNAGLVLAGPYLPRLFAMLGLVQGKAFVDTAAAERGVLLLQYAATGLAAAPETRLALNKLLCGLPLHAPVADAIRLQDAEREAVDGMLTAMIGHWTALGRSSVAGLRQTFLQREGRLEHEADAWQLQVPPQTFDMLLDRLPWGYATLRFPWMPEVLHVQWR